MGVALPLDPSDGETQVYDFYWNNQHTDNDWSNAALIAHEEWHHNGYGEPAAKAMQNECSTWQA